LKLNVADKAALTRVSPDDLQVYLERHGWTLGYTLRSQLAEVWKTRVGEKTHEGEILVPKTRDVVDYSDRIGRILEVVANRLDKSQFDIWSELVSVRSDVVTVRVDPRHETEGRLPAEYAKSVIDGAYDLFLASACSALDPKPYFHARKPDGAVSWLEGLKMGLTRPGSYVFVFILESINDRLGADVMISLEDAPFNRRVLGTASNGLQGIVDAAEIHSKEGGFEGFVERVPRGVSANLCDAVVKIIDPDRVRAVDVSFSWAVKSTSLDVPREIAFEPSIRPTVEQAAEALKEQDPQHDITLVGFIHKLSRKQQTVSSGRIYLETLFFEGRRSVEIELDAETYHRAVVAHDRKRQVSFSGTLKKYGGRFRLDEPHNFRELESASE
jgi:hypothetical protein